MSQDKQLLEQEAEAFASKNFSNKSSFEYHCQYSSYIAGATSSSAVKNLEREVERLKELIYKAWEEEQPNSIKWKQFLNENNL